MRYISLWFYSNEALNINQWTDVEGIKCEFAPSNPRSHACLRSGQEVLSFFAFREVSAITQPIERSAHAAVVHTLFLHLGQAVGGHRGPHGLGCYIQVHWLLCAILQGEKDLVTQICPGVVRVSPAVSA